MTPTEQDKKLREKVAAIIEYWDFSPLQDEDSRIERLKNEILQLITADRKHVALEARIDEIERIDAANIGNGINFWFAHLKKQDSIENNNGWRTMRQYTPERIAELKAQREELGDS